MIYRQNSSGPKHAGIGSGRIITVDCGTTNMRCRLFDGERCLDAVKKQCGSRDLVHSGSSAVLKETLRDLIQSLLNRNGMEEQNVEAVISSGILASDLGIYPIPHAVAPVGISESAAAARMTHDPEVSGIPILFIPGVKTLPAETDSLGKKIEIYESMSGEECEVYGIAMAMGLSGDFIITLPGSYNKAMEVDVLGRITSIRTGLCGELLAALSQGTILKSALPEPVLREILPDMLILGFRMAQQLGVSPMLIKARMLPLLGGNTQDEAANFFVGAALCDDVLSVARLCGEERSRGKPVFVGGSDPLKTVFVTLLKEAGVASPIPVPEETATIASSLGAMAVYRSWKNMFLPFDEKER